MTTATDCTTVVPSFDFQPRTRVIFGAGTLNRLGDVCRDLGAERVLLVTDPGLRDAGHSDRGRAVLESAGLNVSVFDDVCENPTTETVDRCAEFARSETVDFLVGLGGGSSMDCAKGANFLISGGGKMHDYAGVGKARGTMLPMVAVPTTAGTGSEAQSFAVIADAETHLKMPCGDPRAACRVAILDPELSVTMPAAVAAATGVDAMTHALESYVTLRQTEISRMFAWQAWSLLSSAFSAAMSNPDDIESRGRMLLGAHFAGAAIENSMLGAAHAAANPLTAGYSVIHGIAVGIMLPHVIRWNGLVADEDYRRLAAAAGFAGSADASGADCLAEGFTQLLKSAGMPVKISEVASIGESPAAIATMAEQASRQWTGTFNPRPLEVTDFEQLYRNAV